MARRVGTQRRVWRLNNRRHSSPADFTLRISPVKLETAPGRIIKTTGYNGSSPGPILRLQEGKPVTIEVQNETSDQEFVHWHGLFVPSNVDGVADEGTPAVPAHGKQRYSFVPRPSGTRWYHTHVSAGRDLKRSTYTGQFGVLYIEPKNEPGDYDAEIFLTLHGWDPYLSTMGDDEGFLEVGYKSYSINSHALGSGEPIRVQKGQKVIFRIVNASATLAASRWRSVDIPSLSSISMETRCPRRAPSTCSNSGPGNEWTHSSL